ncbi:uncharacterized protein B0T15DRAFT_178000 [Chaetomium strumarium]|uniref:Uncharacterized protein n=1 Tax=Chaetomium strumarium TaxID=1170767 RepID=A0AAJ0M387_9PEZI|nr:hypothetical protein B0T15DRAFT_178000 [Chaetomium strumarium]
MIRRLFRSFRPVPSICLYTLWWMGYSLAKNNLMYKEIKHCQETTFPAKSRRRRAAGGPASVFRRGAPGDDFQSDPESTWKRRTGGRREQGYSGSLARPILVTERNKTQMDPVFHSDVSPGESECNFQE